MFWVFDGIGDSIKDWLQNWFEKINPVTNDVYNTLYWITLNPFDMPNSITAMLTTLTVVAIITYWVFYLLQNVSEFNQKKTAKKSWLIIIFVLLTIWLGSLFYDDNKETTFNLHLVYKKTAWTTAQNTVQNMGYSAISAWTAFSEDPFGNSAGWASRTTVVFTPSDATAWFDIKGSVKYNGLSMVVWVNPLIGKYGDIIDGKTYISQHDIYLSKTPKAVDAWLDLCPQSWSGGSVGLSTFSEMVNTEDDTRLANFKKVATVGENGIWYKLVQCVGSGEKSYKKDLVFLNEGVSEGWNGTSVKRNVFVVIPYYYPLDILNWYTIHNGWDTSLSSANDDFVMKPSVTTWSWSQYTQDEKKRNEKYMEFVARFKANWINKSDFTDGGKWVLDWFNLDKFTEIKGFNITSSWAKDKESYDENPYLTDIVRVSNDILSTLNPTLEKEAQIANKVKNTAITDTWALEEIANWRLLLDWLKTKAETQYADIMSDSKNRLKVFDSIQPSPALSEFKNLSTSERLVKIQYLKWAVEDMQSNASFYNKKEQTLRDIMTDLAKFQKEDKTGTVKIIPQGSAEIRQSLTNFFLAGWELGKSLEDADGFLLKHICWDNKDKIKTVNNNLKNFWIETIEKSIVDCETWVKWTIVDKSKLVGILNQVVSRQYKKDKIADVNLMLYYGKVVNSSEKQAFWDYTSTSYDDSKIVPVKIGSYTFVSPLYYYKKLLSWDFKGLPIFLNLKPIGGKVYMPDAVYDMKIGSPVSWYKDLDWIHGEEYSEDLSVGVPTVWNILVSLLFLLNIWLFIGAFVYIITLFIILLKAD